MDARANRQAEQTTLEQADLEKVAGGLLTVDVSGMPDRTEMCGTMWYLQQLIKKLTGR